MSELVWPEKAIKPDRTGIWAYKGDDGETRVTSIRDEDEWQATWPGKWVRIGDIPEIKEPLKYRDVTEADVGEVVEFTDVEGEGDHWYRDVLRAVSPLNDGGAKYFNSTSGWLRCRILDEPNRERVPQPPKELWAVVFGKLTNALSREDAVGVRRGIE